MRLSQSLRIRRKDVSGFEMRGRGAGDGYCRADESSGAVHILDIGRSREQSELSAPLQNVVGPGERYGAGDMPRAANKLGRPRLVACAPHHTLRAADHGAGDHLERS